MSRYTNILDNVKPASDNEYSFNYIKKTAEARKRSRILKTGAAVGLAAVISCSAVTAAYDMSLKEVLSMWLGGNSDLIYENLSEIKTDNVTNTFENIDIQFTGSYYDGELTLLFADIIRTDGKAFDTAEYDAVSGSGEPYIIDGVQQTDISRYEFSDSYIDSEIEESIDIPGRETPISCRIPVSYRMYTLNDENPKDSKITVVFCISGDIGELLSDDGSAHLFIELGTLKNKKCLFEPLKSGEGVRAEAYYPEMISGKWKGRICVSTASHDSVALYPNETVHIMTYPHTNDPEELINEETDFTVREITLSEFTLQLRMDRPVPDGDGRYVYAYGMCDLILKDGRRVTVHKDAFEPCFLKESGNNNYLKDLIEDDGYTWDYDKWDCDIKFVITDPVGLDEVAAVRVGDKTFEIN